MSNVANDDLFICFKLILVPQYAEAEMPMMLVLGKDGTLAIALLTLVSQT